MPKKLKGGSSKQKTFDIIDELFIDKDMVVKFLPSSNMLVNNLSHKYVNMVTLTQLRNIIDSNPNLKKSTTIMDIYNNKKIIDLKDIYENISLTYVDNSLIDNVKILFQYILDYDKYIHRDTNLYSVITCNDRFDPIYEKQQN